jgi:hypothetical protein
MFTSWTKDTLKRGDNIMKYLYAIVEESSGMLHNLTSTGGSRGINNDLLYHNDDWLDFNNTFKSADEMLFMASVITTRHKDTNWASCELNKLYSALSKYRYFMVSYEQEMEVEEMDIIDMKLFEVEETKFLVSLFNSESCSIIKQASVLTNRLERKEITVDVVIGSTYWCYTTDFCPRKEDRSCVTITLPLSVTTYSVKSYISNIVSKNYRFGLREDK